MDYISDTLNPGEIICYRGKVSVSYIVVRIFFAVIFLFTIIVPLCLSVVVLRAAMTKFVITNKRIIIKSGIISRNISDIALSKCEGVSFRQGFWGRLFNWGTLVTSGVGVQKQSFSGLNNPVEFRNELFRIMEENKK